MRVDGITITPKLVRALMALPRFEKYVQTVQCKGCKMVQRSKITRDRHKEDCPVARVEGILLLMKRGD